MIFKKHAKRLPIGSDAFLLQGLIGGHWDTPVIATTRYRRKIKFNIYQYISVHKIFKSFRSFLTLSYTSEMGSRVSISLQIKFPTKNRVYRMGENMYSTATILQVNLAWVSI
jgi:hypothetical protein